MDKTFSRFIKNYSIYIQLKNSQIIDIGTGAGLPGIPISLSLKNSNNQIYLCESKKEKN